jgi:hypothetical protein
MADGNRITFIVEGFPEDEGRLRLSAFVNELQNLSATITRIDRETHHGRPANYFRIAELSYGNPARIVLEPHATGREPCTGHIVIESLERVREAFANGTDLDEIDADLLADIGRLAKPVGT